MLGPHVHRQTLALVLVDVLAYLTAFVVGMHLRFGVDLGLFEAAPVPWAAMLRTLPVMLAVWLSTSSSAGLYRLHGESALLELSAAVKAIGLMSAVLLSATFFYRGFSYSRGFAIMFLPSLLVLTFGGRLALRAALKRLAGFDADRRRVLLVGVTSIAEHLARDSGLALDSATVVGVLDDKLAPGTRVEGTLVLGGTKDLVEAARAHRAHGIIITDPKMEEARQLELLDTCLDVNLEWRVVPSTYELMLDRFQLEVVSGVPVIGMRGCNIRGANRAFKRAFDLLVASLALCFLGPLMALIAILIRATSKGPVLYTQERIGENGAAFRFFKFRSMRVDSDEDLHRRYARAMIVTGAPHTVDAEGALYKMHEDPRITRVGSFIRRYSIDELPQLLNVLRGDMSLVGPRPSIPYEVEVYRRWHKRRLEGPPGMTGLWQVSGRNRLSFDEMVKLDIEYLENWSFGRDLKILWRTMGAVLSGRAY